MGKQKSWRASRAHDSRGFTTVEMVLSGLLLLIISSSTYVLFTRSQKFFVSQHQLVAAQQNARAALDYMTETISLAGFGLPTSGLYSNLKLTDPDPANSNRSAFSNFGGYDVAVAPMDQTHIYLKGNFSKVYGSLTTAAGVTFPGGSNSTCSAAGTAYTFTVQPLATGSSAGSFSMNDVVFVYDFNPGNALPFYWAYGTVTSSGSGSPQAINLTITDCTPPSTSGYTFGQGTLLYKVDTRAFRLNGSVLEVSENNGAYETLTDHVNALSFRYFDKTNKEVTNCSTGVLVRSTVQKVQIQITTEGVNNDLQSKKPLRVTYSSTATPRNANF